MTSVTFAIFATILYILCTILILKQLREKSTQENHHHSSLTLIVGALGIICHGLVAYNTIITDAGINLGLFNALSLSSAIIALLTLSALLVRPVGIMAIIILPVSAILLILSLVFPSSHVLSANTHPGLLMHVVISIVAYSLMGLASFHAILLAIQNRHLHNHQTGGIVRMLPPLKVMESLLFEIILVGFILLSVALLSGFAYLENLFAQHLVHKTILSILAWVLFAILLIGHWKLGWRGRTAVRWTLGGFICLMLAYVGSKFVLEFLI